MRVGSPRERGAHTSATCPLQPAAYAAVSYGLVLARVRIKHVRGDTYRGRELKKKKKKKKKSTEIEVGGSSQSPHEGLE
jgi:hypothetical protein